MAKTTTRRVRRLLPISRYPRRRLDGSKVEAGLYGTNISCGVRELFGVSHRAPIDLIRELDTKHLAHVVFSDRLGGPRYDNESGENFAQFIRDNNLGPVLQSEVRMNPNSRNRIAVWVWTPNKVAVRHLLKARG